MANISVRCGVALGLRASNLLCIVNSDSALSVAVAAHYRTRRALNANQFLELSLPLPSNNQMTPAQYATLSAAIEAYITSSGLPVKCLVMMPDIPVSVCWPDLSLMGVDNNLAVGYPTVVSGQGQILESGYHSFYGATQHPFTDYVQDRSKGNSATFRLVSRLDGPGVDAEAREACIKGLIDSAVDNDGLGMLGKFYFDKTANLDLWWAAYDAQLAAGATAATAKGKTSVLEPTVSRQVFDGAAGFYHGGYTNPPAFQVAQSPFNLGSIAAELQSGGGIRLDVLNNGYLYMLCADYIRQGVAGTWGPVGEPGLASFPNVSQMLAALFLGLTWGEAWWLSNPYVGWKQYMVGDPLYRPF